MSGFIDVSGGDLDLVFQKRLPVVTTGLIDTGYKTADGIDLIYRFQTKSNHTYPQTTGFIAINGSNLTSMFEWGG